MLTLYLLKNAEVFQSICKIPRSAISTTIPSFALFVKNAFVDADFSLILKIEALGTWFEHVSLYSNKKAITFAIDLKNHKNQLWDTTSNRLYYVDSDHREYDIPICRTELITLTIKCAQNYETFGSGYLIWWIILIQYRNMNQPY